VVAASRKLYSEEITAAGTGALYRQLLGSCCYASQKGLVVTFDKVGSWESNSLYYAQYNVSIENHNSNEVASWNCSPESA